MRLIITIYIISRVGWVKRNDPSLSCFVRCASVPTTDKTDYYAKFTGNIFKYGGFAHA